MVNKRPCSPGNTSSGEYVLYRNKNRKYTNHNTTVLVPGNSVLLVTNMKLINSKFDLNAVLYGMDGCGYKFAMKLPVVVALW